MAKIVDPDLLADEASYTGATEVFINTSTKTIRLTVVGDLSSTGVQNENGVTLKCLYSFLKEEWRLDPHTKNLAAFPFPMVPITDESFEFVDGWDFYDDAARYLIRDAGWFVRNTSGNLTQIWSGVIGLGSIESDDQLYYQQASVGSAVNVGLTGQINQAVPVLADANGDGSYVDGFDRRTYFVLFGREYQQLYGKASLTDIGVSSLTGQAYRFPISTGGDTLKITDNDTDVGANSPFTGIVVRYFDQAFSRDVDSTTDRSFGIVVDVGTHSGVDGVCTSGGSTFTTAEGGIVGATYAGGTLTIHEGANAGTYTISGTPAAGSVTITSTFPASNSDQSFTLQRATPVVATAEEIYTKVQYLLRQNVDINTFSAAPVTGKTADQLMYFVGDTLITGRAPTGAQPANPAGGGSGVFIAGFQASDTNRITFYDNSDVARTFPYVATLTLQFGANLVADASAKYWVYYTTTVAGDDFGEATAILVDDATGTDMAGNVSASSSISLTYDYDNNTQGGRSGGDPDITAVAIGLTTGQYVKATGTIQRSTSNTLALVAALERNYQNP